MAEYADATREEGDLEQSHALFARADDIAKRAGLTSLKTQITVALADLEDHREGSAVAEWRLLAEAEDTTARGDDADAAFILTTLAELHRRWGERERWRQLRDRARALGAELPDDEGQRVNVTAPDVPNDVRRRVARFVVATIDLLGVAVDEITISIWNPERDDEQSLDWALTPDGIAMHPWLLELPDSRAWIRLAATVHGAVVSYLLDRDGVDIQVPLGETLHEIARSWIVQRRFVIDGPLLEDSPMVPILGDSSEGLQTARVLGAALAGNAVARSRFEQWRRSHATRDEQELSDLFVESLSSIATPAELLLAVTAMFRTATAQSDAGDV